jgi:hypothetical protein
MPRMTTPAPTSLLPGILEDCACAASRLQDSASHLRGLLLALRVQAESANSAEALSELILAVERVGQEYLSHIDGAAADVRLATRRLADA